MQKYIRFFGFFGKKIEYFKISQFLFYIMYNLHNSYFVFIVNFVNFGFCIFLYILYIWLGEVGRGEDTGRVEAERQPRGGAAARRCGEAGWRRGRARRGEEALAVEC